MVGLWVMQKLKKLKQPKGRSSLFYQILLKEYPCSISSGVQPINKRWGECQFCEANVFSLVFVKIAWVVVLGFPAYHGKLVALDQKLQIGHGSSLSTSDCLKRWFYIYDEYTRHCDLETQGQ